jgi:hypothetical protein
MFSTTIMHQSEQIEKLYSQVGHCSVGRCSSAGGALFQKKKQDALVVGLVTAAAGQRLCACY